MYMVEFVLEKESDCISLWTLKPQKEWCNRIKIYYREQERTEETPQKSKNWRISLTTDIRINDEGEDDLLAFYYLSISISPERPRLGALASPGWEFGYRLRILIKAFLFNWLFLLLSHSVVSDSLWPHGLQHSRLPCPSLSPWVYSNSCPLSQWCHPTISSSVVPFFSGLQSFPASGSFPMSHFFLSCGQSIGASAPAWILPMSYSGLISFRIDWFVLSKGLSRVFSSTTVQKHQFFSSQPSLWSNSHVHT